MTVRLDDIEYDEDDQHYPCLHVSFRTQRNSM